MVNKFLTFTLSVANNVFFIGLFGLFDGGGVGPLVNTAKLDTIPVTDHIYGSVTAGCSPGGRMLGCYVSDGVSNMVNSTITTNILVSFLKWAIDEGGVGGLQCNFMGLYQDFLCIFL